MIVRFNYPGGMIEYAYGNGARVPVENELVSFDGSDPHTPEGIFRVAEKGVHHHISIRGPQVIEIDLVLIRRPGTRRSIT